jgi:hypothetical protein
MVRSGFQPEVKPLDDLWFTSSGSGQTITDPFLELFRSIFWPTEALDVKGHIFTAYWTLKAARQPGRPSPTRRRPTSRADAATSIPVVCTNILTSHLPASAAPVSQLHSSSTLPADCPSSIRLSKPGNAPFKPAIRLHLQPFFAE